MNELAQLSLLVIYAAMASYMVAFVSFSVDLSALRARRDSDGRVIKRSRVLVGAGAPVLEVAPLAESDDVAGPAGTGDSDLGGRRRRAAGIAVSTMWLGTAFHGIGVVLRGVAAGHVPWSNMYEFTITFTFVAAVIFLVLARRHDLRYLGAFVTGPTLLLLGVATSVLYTAAEGLRPILDNYWLYLHVSVASIAVAVLAIAAMLAGLQLAKDFTSGSSSRWTAVLSGLPGADALERLSYRFTAVGFVLWTFTLIAGAIWAEHAWGRAWGWDAKEVWTFVIWVIYAAYLHARATRGWDGRRAAALVMVGFTAILANYFVVNFLLSTNHGYAF